jgi:hypothetical protein
MKIATGILKQPHKGLPPSSAGKALPAGYRNGEKGRLVVATI